MLHSASPLVTQCLVAIDIGPEEVESRLPKRRISQVDAEASRQLAGFPHTRVSEQKVKAIHEPLRLRIVNSEQSQGEGSAECIREAVVADVIDREVALCPVHRRDG